MEDAGVGGGGVEEAVLVRPAPPLALNLAHCGKGSERLGIANAWLELGTTRVDQVGLGWARY